MNCSFSLSEFGMQFHCFIFLIHLVQYFNVGCVLFGYVRLDLDLMVMFASIMVASNIFPSTVVSSDEYFTWIKIRHALNYFSAVVSWSLLCWSHLSFAWIS